MPDQLSTWLTALDRFELKLRGRIGRERNRLIVQVAGTYARGTIPFFAFADHERKVANILKAHYGKVIPHFAGQAVSQIRSKKFEQKQLDGLFAFLIEQWITRQALAKAKLISGTDRDDILSAITQGIEEGLGTDQIARSIRKVSGMTPIRAATIARTETHGAATFGSIESVREAEQELGVVMLKRWLPTLDARTREDHAAMAGHKAIPLGERFDMGGVMMDRPGDPSAPARLVINCRCAIAYEEAE